jgi:PAS domain S-box-containing protein
MNLKMVLNKCIPENVKWQNRINSVSSFLGSKDKIAKSERKLFIYLFFIAILLISSNGLFGQDTSKQTAIDPSEVNLEQNGKIESQSVISELQELKIHRQRNLVYLLVITLLLLGILAFSIYRRFKNKHRLNKELEMRVAERTLEMELSNKQLTIELSERIQAEKRLMESESKYRTLLENLPQKIFFKNRDLLFVSCNEIFARELNINPSEIEGKTDYDFFPKELAERYRMEDAEFLKAGKLLEIEECILRDGQTLWTQIVKVPVKDAAGEIIGVQGIFWDITDRKLDEEKLQRINEEPRGHGQ